jgi:hypothetical protein
VTSFSELLNQRKWLETGLLDAYREADKLIVTVSSAVLALSVAFVGQIDNPVNTESLKFAWTLFLAAIGTVLMSLVFEQRERIARIARIDKAIKDTDVDHRDARRWWGKVAGYLNIAGVVSFFFALFQLASFLSANLV